MATWLGNALSPEEAKKNQEEQIALREQSGRDRDARNQARQRSNERRRQQQQDDDRAWARDLRDQGVSGADFDKAYNDRREQQANERRAASDARDKRMQQHRERREAERNKNYWLTKTEEGRAYKNAKYEEKQAIITALGDQNMIHGAANQARYNIEKEYGDLMKHTNDLGIDGQGTDANMSGRERDTPRWNEYVAARDNYYETLESGGFQNDDRNVRQRDRDRVSANASRAFWSERGMENPGDRPWEGFVRPNSRGNRGGSTGGSNGRGNVNSAGGSNGRGNGNNNGGGHDARIPTPINGLQPGNSVIDLYNPGGGTNNSNNNNNNVIDNSDNRGNQSGDNSNYDNRGNNSGDNSNYNSNNDNRGPQGGDNSNYDNRGPNSGDNSDYRGPLSGDDSNYNSNNDNRGNNSGDNSEYRGDNAGNNSDYRGNASGDNSDYRGPNSGDNADYRGNQSGDNSDYSAGDGGAGARGGDGGAVDNSNTGNIDGNHSQDWSNTNTMTGDRNTIYNNIDSSNRTYGGDTRIFNYTRGGSGGSGGSGGGANGGGSGGGAGTNVGDSYFYDTPASMATMGGFYEVNDSPARQAAFTDLHTTNNRDNQRRYAGSGTAIANMFSNYDSRNYTPESMATTIGRSTQDSYDRADDQTGWTFGDIWHQNYAPTNWEMPEPPKPVELPDDLGDDERDAIEDA